MNKPNEKLEKFRKQAQESKKDHPGQAKQPRVNSIKIEGKITNVNYYTTQSAKEMFKFWLDYSQGTNRDGTWKPTMRLFCTMWHNDDPTSEQAWVESIDTMEDDKKVVVEGKLTMSQKKTDSGAVTQYWGIDVWRVSDIS